MAKPKKRTTKPAAKPAAADALDALIAKALGGDAKSRHAVRDGKAGQVVPKLVAQFTADKPKHRAAAIGLATGTLPFIKLVPLDALLATLGDADPSVRLAAAIGLKSTFPIKPFFAAHAETIRPALAPCLEDADQRVREQAGYAWIALGLTN